jgi:5-methylcytosine-specific restriction endonuclease McrA
MNSQLKHADKLWGQAMHDMYQHCAKCGSPIFLEAHHIIHRNHKLTRHDLLNGIMLCRSCHAWAHAHPKAFDEWLAFNKMAQWSWAQRNKNRTGKPDYERAIRELKETMRGYGGRRHRFFLAF